MPIVLCNSPGYQKITTGTLEISQIHVVTWYRHTMQPKTYAGTGDKFIGVPVNRRFIVDEERMKKKMEEKNSKPNPKSAVCTCELPKDW
ncbi:hypothetical protein C5167_025767 [Papaver somniferum]|uniref:Uncharacterized protein n=1 Tax=Papaver somniferum TaxID=3469 RepID=A0A4Y7JWB2_PAPSO|nr:hypothetical protein C5167_025767 [Papaver somniferum]